MGSDQQWPPPRRIDTCPPRFIYDTSKSRGETVYLTTGDNDTMKRVERPCAYCGTWAPVDVHQRLGCGAPR